MSEDEFWDITPRAFHNKLKGFTDALLFKEREEWERCRWQTMVLVNPHIKKRIRKPKELIEFEWDKREVDIVRLKDEKYWDRLNKKLKDKI